MQRCWILIIVTGVLVACSSDSPSTSSDIPATAPASTAHGDLEGVVVEAPSNTIAFLVAETDEAGSLFDQAARIRTSAEVGRDGRFSFAVTEQGPLSVLVSAPGRALTWTPLTRGLPAQVTLGPEATMSCAVTSDGAPDEDALGLVLDADGRVMPLPPASLVSDASGVLRATRLPAGRYELLVASGDGARHASAGFSVAAGGSTELRLALEVDADLELRFLRVVGGPELTPFLEEVAR